MEADDTGGWVTTHTAFAVERAHPRASCRILSADDAMLTNCPLEDFRR